MMSIKFLTIELKKPRLLYKVIIIWLRKVILIHDRIPGKITYIFCDDSKLLELNIEFLGHDYYTDVLTFDYSNDNVISGDIYISVDRVMENSLFY